ncbi:hypothetical protein [Yinghuangia soli]|uniref:Fibronectin type-III domain-containing protein n=1 Tax=Yinghuangia soli TaxID=2908204 RepID=A0AA41PW06_9ACTN|nr:hypothetical protein [Yinghuangia soli]MCF2526736.1 hypothetical protein [Yinghuangia soli]
MAGIVVAGIGASGADPDLSDIGAWLTSDNKSSVAHVNGLTGQVDGRIQLPRGEKTQLQVSDDGRSVLVLDAATGKVSRIDPAQLTVPQSYDYATQGLQLVTGGGKAWLVDAAASSVRAIDPVTLTPLGDPVKLDAGQLGRPQADAAGTLWIPAPEKGLLIPFTDKPGAEIRVAEPGGVMLFGLAAGRPVVVDVAGGTLLVVSTRGIDRTITLPAELTKGAPGKLKSPGRSDGPVVPILASDTGVLTAVDIDTGSVKAVPLALGPHSYADPQVLGAKVYVPDRTTGQLVVYNFVRAQFEAQIKVTGVPGELLDSYVRDGLLWVNDPERSTAAVVDLQGQVHLITKTNDPKAPNPAGSSGAVPTPAKSVPEGGVTESQSAPGSPSASVSGSTPQTDGKPTATGGPVPTGDPVPGGPGGGTGGGAGTGPTRGPDDPGDGGGNTDRPTRTPNPRPTKTPGEPEPTKEPPAPTTQAPEPTTPAPDPTTPAPTTKAPDPTTKAPDPTTKPPAPTTSKPTSSSPPPMRAPGIPTAASGPGKITLVFQPSSGAVPTRYRVGGVGAGMGVTPASVPAKGPFTFTVSGGSCDQEYSFYIIADFPNGQMNSGRSTPVRPCVAAGKPTALSAQAVSGGKVKVSWKPPTNTAGEKVTYTATWASQAKPAAAVGPAAFTADTADTASELSPPLVADPPAVNEAFAPDGIVTLAAKKAGSGKATTTSTSVTFSVGGVAGSYTFTVKAANGAGSTTTATATLTVDLTWGKTASAVLVAPPEVPGTAPYPPTPYPGSPGTDVGGPVAAGPPRRDPAEPSM